MRFHLSPWLLGRRGGALIYAMLVTSIMGAGGIYLIKSGLLQKQMSKEILQEHKINEAVDNINSFLADSRNCTTADTTGFQTIDTYSVGNNIAADVLLNEIVVSPEVNRERTIELRFAKRVMNGSQVINKIVKKEIRVKRYQDTNTGADFCISFETVAGDNAITEFCEDMGGTLDGNGRCDFDDLASNPSNFRDRLLAAACTAIGGTAVGGVCDRIDVTGNVQSSHFRTDDIDVATNDRSGFVSGSCTGFQVANGVNPNGSPRCTNITCDKLEPSGSDYVPRLAGGEIHCVCQRNKPLGTNYECGQTAARNDTDFCLGNREFDDGCGRGETCTIYQGNFTCPQNGGTPACEETVQDTDACGRVCNTRTGPPCPPPPPPRP